MNTINLIETIGSIAAKDYPKTEAIRSMDNDIWCNNDRSIGEANLQARVTSEKLPGASGHFSLSEMDSPSEFTEWELDALVDYIINTHHQYAKANAIIIYDLVQKVTYRHCERHPGLIKLTATLFLFLHDLLNQMGKEEQILFPNIKQLIKSKRDSGKCEHTTIALIKEWVFLMLKKHQAAGQYIKSIHELTNNYLLPDDACNSYKLLFEKMKEFELDFSMHAHLENNILLATAIAGNGYLDGTTLAKKQ